MAGFDAAFDFPFDADPLVFDDDVIPVATFAPSVEDGAKVTLEWRTDVLTAWSGKEQRVSLLGAPRQRYEFTTVLSDDQQRLVMAELADHAADGAAFLIGLPYEELSVIDGSGSSVDVSSLSLTDWAVVGQRAIVVAPDGEFGDGAIQSIGVDTITLDSLPAGVARTGARIMPAMVVYLEPTQQLSRYVMNAGRWAVSALAARFRWGDSSVVGTGAGLMWTTFEDMPVWIAGIRSELAAQPMFTGADVQDLGFSAKPMTRHEQAAWGRAIRIESSRRIDWQWLKLFLWTVRGRAQAFLLPSGRPDLVPIGDASSGVLLVDDATDYAAKWFPSLAHRRLALVLADGSVAYRSVASAIDNGDGTQSLTLSAAAAGELERVEFLEVVRLESDEVTVEWHDGVTFTCDLMARVIPQLDADDTPATYDAAEKSVESGEPVELYKLETNSGTLLFTSAAEDVTFSGNTYYAIPLSRSNVSPPRIGEGREITITMPVNHPAALDLLSNGIPQQDITVTISRVHSIVGTARQIWRGNVMGATTDQQWLRITTLRDHDDTLSIQLPLAKGSRKCQHQLYDAGCRAGALVNFTEIATVNGTTLTVNDAFPSNGWANGGDIIAGSERRSVLSQVGTTLVIDVPFRDVEIGTSVLVRAGCNKTITTCKDKFDNVANFGGHPQKPPGRWMEPFTYGIRSRLP